MKRARFLLSVSLLCCLPSLPQASYDQLSRQYQDLGNSYLRLETSYRNLNICLLAAIPAALLTGFLTAALVIK
jgi:hypothetical protein